MNNELWLSVFVILGACVGSFLNVAIYRVPRGLSVNEPKRSFCPACKYQIPWYRNIPILTWILQGGRCANCGSKIAFHYVLVEILTAVLFGLVWYFYPNGAAGLGVLFVALLVGISFIDGEHYVIPVNWCYWGAGLAVVLSSVAPQMIDIPQMAMFFPRLEGWMRGSALSFMGAVGGYLILVAVVRFGKLAFGKRKVLLETHEKWFLREPQTEDEQLEFVLGEDSIGWGEMFYRPTDRLEIEGKDFIVDGKKVKGRSMSISESKVTIGEQSYAIEEIKSLEGKAKQVIIPREAMGGGDPPLLGMIGAFLGLPAVIFTLFTSAIYALVAAVLGRVGLGKPLPYGPFLALGALTWMMGGYRLMERYLILLGY